MKLKLVVVIDLSNMQSEVEHMEVVQPSLPAVPLTQTQKLEAAGKPASRAEVVQFVTQELRLSENDGRWLWDHWNGSGFKVAGKAMKSWKHTARAWMRANIFPSLKGKKI